jgi:hypothetical protein
VLREQKRVLLFAPNGKTKRVGVKTVAEKGMKVITAEAFEEEDAAKRKKRADAAAAAAGTSTTSPAGGAAPAGGR